MAPILGIVLFLLWIPFAAVKVWAAGGKLGGEPWNVQVERRSIALQLEKARLRGLAGRQPTHGGSADDDAPAFQPKASQSSK